MANLQVIGGRALISVGMSISRRLKRSLDTASRAGHICVEAQVTVLFKFNLKDKILPDWSRRPRRPHPASNRPTIRRIKTVEGKSDR